MSDLDALYRQARYVVDDDDVSFTIRIGDSNDGLKELLAERGTSAWAYLTACNPNSQPLSDEENEVRQAEFIERLIADGYTYLRGYGTGDDWDPEPSLLVLAIGRDAAVGLGREFGQNAILWGESDGVPELVWCDA